MLMHDEIRPTKGIDTGAKGSAPKNQLDAALRLVDAMTVDWDPTRYEDEYRKRLQKVVAQKRRGGTVTMPEQAEEPTPVPDLMAALRESLQAARGGGGRRTGDGLEGLSRDELYERAQKADVPGRSSMTKKELIAALS
jgi:DNA end-binding protein Ku